MASDGAIILITGDSMAQVLVRELDSRVIRRLKEQAGRHGRSLEAELRLILEKAAGSDLDVGRRLAARIRLRLAGHAHSDSASLLAEDRRR
jgi:plasmid stability protein